MQGVTVPVSIDVEWRKRVLKQQSFAERTKERRGKMGLQNDDGGGNRQLRRGIKNPRETERSGRIHNK